MIFGMLILIFCQAEATFVDEQNIQKEIFVNYSKTVRPSIARTIPVYVEFDVLLQSLVDFDVRQQVLTIVTMTMMRWTDLRLRWNPFQHWLGEINVESSEVWTPDIVLYNTAESSSTSHTDLYKTKIQVRYDGVLTWNAPVTWYVSCSSDVTWFPFDKQICQLTFGSWSYPASKLSLVFFSNETDDLTSSVFKVENGEWKIVDKFVCEKRVSFACCKEHFNAISTVYVLDRLSLYYFIYILIPLFLPTVLFMLLFVIPHDSGERTGFGVTVLLSITVYLLVISEQLPEKSNQTPVLGVCFTELFFILSFALAMGVLTMNMPKFTRKPPRILLIIVQKLAARRELGSSASVLPLWKFKEKFETKDSGEMTQNHEHDFEQGDRNVGKEDFSDDWSLIATYLDRFFVFFFMFLIVVLPAITVEVISSQGRVGEHVDIEKQCKIGDIDVY